MTFDPNTELREIESIKRLKARYFRFIDSKEFDKLPSIFTEDFEYADDAKERIISGRDAFVQFIIDRHSNSVSVHQGTTPEIEVISETDARGLWAMSDFVILPQSTNGRLIQRGSGHYHEKYRKEDGVWKIAHIHLTRIWLSIETQAEEFINVTTR